jgi:hypothetical protein
MSECNCTTEDRSTEAISSSKLFLSSVTLTHNSQSAKFLDTGHNVQDKITWECVPYNSESCSYESVEPPTDTSESDWTNCTTTNEDGIRDCPDIVHGMDTSKPWVNIGSLEEFKVRITFGQTGSSVVDQWYAEYYSPMTGWQKAGLAGNYQAGLDVENGDDLKKCDSYLDGKFFGVNPIGYQGTHAFGALNDTQISVTGDLAHEPGYNDCNPEWPKEMTTFLSDDVTAGATSLPVDDISEVYNTLKKNSSSAAGDLKILVNAGGDDEAVYTVSPSWDGSSSVSSSILDVTAGLSIPITTSTTQTHSKDATVDIVCDDFTGDTEKFLVFVKTDSDEENFEIAIPKCSGGIQCKMSATAQLIKNCGKFGYDFIEIRVGDGEKKYLRKNDASELTGDNPKMTIGGSGVRG